MLHLIEVQGIQQIIQLAVLLLFIQHDIVLDKSVQSELGLIIHVDLHRLHHMTALPAECIYEDSRQ